MENSVSNQIGLDGISFIEFSAAETSRLEELFFNFGFSKLKIHSEKKVSLFKQNKIFFFLNSELGSYSQQFSKQHGPCISSMGWRFKDRKMAFNMAISKGACPAEGDYIDLKGNHIPAVYGIGKSLIYFIDNEVEENDFSFLGFKLNPKAFIQESKGFTSIDHLTNNVENGQMKIWSDFYKNIFGFSEVRYFDIRGVKTGLTSYALKSPCGQFCIPINEAKEAKSQINEYLEEYKGPGIQHLAFLTEDILFSLDAMKGTGIQTLDIDNEYYQDIFNKFPQVTENHQKIQEHQVLVDGDSEGYLLQIFTKNVVGPIFIEIIQRKNHDSFGEGNFGALFRSIERDQVKRGYL